VKRWKTSEGAKKRKARMDDGGKKKRKTK